MGDQGKRAGSCRKGLPFAEAGSLASSLESRCLCTAYFSSFKKLFSPVCGPPEEEVQAPPFLCHSLSAVIRALA